MKLIIFPGAGSPDNTAYSKVYDLLESRAPEYGYTSVDSSLRWPGHINDQGVATGSLELKSAVSVAEEKLMKLERAREDYTILARSFGCTVSTSCVTTMQLEKLSKLILWGPPPYALMWEMFVRDLDINAKDAREKGVIMDEAIFPSLTPLESLLPQVPCETVVATGAEDPYVPPAFLEYLRSRTKNNNNITFKAAAPGVGHEVPPRKGRVTDQEIQTYLDTLFK